MSCPSIRRMVSTTVARISPDTCTMLTIKPKHIFRWDVPSSLRQHLKEKLQYFATKFQLLFSVVSLPNILMPFLAGVTGEALVPFESICLTGVLLCTIAAMHGSWPLSTLGRLGFGLGFESAFVSNQNVLVSCITRSQIGTVLYGE